MDNKKINIDQLFQSRFDNFESPMPEHAWGQMKSILDVEMPEKKKRLGFGPFLNVVALSVILASASFGGYQLLKGEIAADAGKRFTLEPYADNKVSNVSKPNATASVPASSDNDMDAATQMASIEKWVDGKVLPSTTSTNHWQKQANASRVANTEAGTSTKKETNHSVQEASTVSKNRVSQEDAQVLTNTQSATAVTTTHTDTKTLDNVVASNAQGAATNETSTSNIPTTIINQNNSNNQTNNNQVVLAQTDANDADKATTSNMHTEASTTKDSIKYIAQHTKLTIDRVNQKAITHTEIVETGKIEAPVHFQNGQATDQLAMAMANDASASLENNVDNSSIGLAAQRQTSTHKKANTYTKQSSQKIDELKTQAKYLVQQMYFSYGILGGANFTALNGGNLYGFHLGLHGAFHFNEKWSIAAEVRFRQQFNSGFELEGYKNQLRSVDSLETLNGKIYNYHYDSMNTNYKFATIQSLNVPIMLQYNMAKWRLMAGVNINYTFNIGTEELAYSYPNIFRDTVFGINTSPKSFEQNSSMTYRDFQNKFGLGFMFGLGYEMTPRVTLDLRMMQNQYNNAFTQGEKTISKHLLSRPNFQFTIQYKLGEKKLK